MATKRIWKTCTSLQCRLRLASQVTDWRRIRKQSRLYTLQRNTSYQSRAIF